MNYSEEALKAIEVRYCEQCGAEIGKMSLAAWLAADGNCDLCYGGE